MDLVTKVQLVFKALQDLFKVSKVPMVQQDLVLKVLKVPKVLKVKSAKMAQQVCKVQMEQVLKVLLVSKASKVPKDFKVTMGLDYKVYKVNSVTMDHKVCKAI